VGFNLINGLVSGVEGFLGSGGNPGMGLAMGAAGAFGGSNNLAGNLGNSTLEAIDAQDEAFQVGMYAEQTRHQEQMQLQSQAFDEMMDERSEQMREVNTLRDVQMQQRKADDQITKKFIQSITE
jgi:hypothetical protein